MDIVQHIVVGEEQVLEVPKRRQFSTVAERVDAADRLEVEKLKSLQAERVHLRQSGCVQVRKMVGHEQVEHLQIGQRAVSCSLRFGSSPNRCPALRVARTC